MANTDTGRERREREREAVAREMSRLRAAEDPDEAGTEENDLVETVQAEQRERDAQDD
jgi:hypothetical protein